MAHLGGDDASSMIRLSASSLKSLAAAATMRRSTIASVSNCSAHLQRTLHGSSLPLNVTVKSRAFEPDAESLVLTPATALMGISFCSASFL